MLSHACSRRKKGLGQVLRLVLRPPHPTPAGGQSTHASSPRLSPLGDQPAVPAWSGAAVSTAQRLTVASSLSTAFLLEKSLPVQTSLSEHQGQSHARFAPFPAAGRYLSTAFDTGMVPRAAPGGLPEASWRVGYPGQEFTGDFQCK